MYLLAKLLLGTCTLVLVNPTLADDCSCSEWVDSSTCTAECDGGSVEQTRTCTEATDDGLTCAELGLEETEQTILCNTQVCPVATDCSCTSWVDSSSCSAECAGGSRDQTRSCTEPTNGGQTCSELGLDTTQSVFCNTQPCLNPTDCSCTGWVDTSTCSAECGGGVLGQIRTCTEATDGGESCSSLGLSDSRVVSCNTQECSQDCTCGQWADTTSCSALCGGGTKEQSRSCGEATNGGQTCAVLELTSTQSVTCNTQECSEDCSCGDWTDSTICTAECGGGTLKQSRTCSEATNGGETCVALGLGSMQVIECNTQACPQDCSCTEWQDTSTCSAPCGGGIKDQSRVCTEAVNGGETCADLGLLDVKKTILCNNDSCGDECSCMAWSTNNSCPTEIDANCGQTGLTTTLTRTCTASEGSAENIICPQETSSTITCEFVACAQVQGEEENVGGGSNVGLIAGAAAGGAVALVALTLVGLVVYKRVHRNKGDNIKNKVSTWRQEMAYEAGEQNALHSGIGESYSVVSMDPAAAAENNVIS